jgi:glycosyltransferase involved in cell wall biosynthesis
MKPKLLFLVSEDWYFVAHRLELAKAATKAGFEVGVATRVARHAEKILDSGLSLHPIKIDRSSLNPITAVSELAELTALYAAHQPDIAHNVAMKPIILGSRAARRACAKGIVNSIAGFGYAFASEDAKARLARQALRIALRGALCAPRTLVTVENKADLDQLANERLAPSDRTRLVPGVGLDVRSYDVGAPPPGPPLVVLPARLLRYKGVPVFVEAARRLKEEGLTARFALVGAPDSSNPASVSDDEIEAWRAEGAVEIWGWRSDMRDVLRQASIVCLPSFYREGLPVSLLEAAAARRAIVTTDMPGCRDVVDSGACGWLAAPREVRSLVEALRSAILSPQRCAAFADAAYRRALDHYDIAIIKARYLELYEELLRSARPT